MGIRWRTKVFFSRPLPNLCQQKWKRHYFMRDFLRTKICGHVQVHVSMEDNISQHDHLSGLGAEVNTLMVSIDMWETVLVRKHC